jgi:hypothetical protein
MSNNHINQRLISTVGVELQSSSFLDTILPSNNDNYLNDNGLSQMKGSVRENDTLIYIEQTRRPVDLNKLSSYMIIGRIILLNIILSSVVILIPLGGLTYSDINNTTKSDSPQIYNWSYIVFQIAYNLIAFNVVVRIFSVPLRNVLPWSYIWIILPILGLVGVFFIYYFLIVNNTTVSNDSVIGLLPAFGCDFLVLSVWFSFFIGGIYSMFKQKNWQIKKDILSIADSEVFSMEEKKIYDDNYDNISLSGYGSLLIRFEIKQIILPLLYYNILF